MSVATTSGLTVRYGRRIALDSLSIEVPEGCVGLLGPNGAGKTTLIKCLLGFLTPDRGTGTVLGYDIHRAGLKIRQVVGLMPEVDCHIPGMNAVTFVSYAGELAGMPAAQALRRAHEVLEYCGLGEARYRSVDGYSTGMKQRIKFAQALVHGPRLVFLDEPTNGLDPAGREEMLNLVRDVSHGKGLSVVVSSHLLPDIERTCDSVIVMRGGKVAAQGTLDELKAGSRAEYDVELNLPSPKFAAALSEAGATSVRETGHRIRAGFAAPPEDTGALLFACADRAGVQVRGFEPAVRSLEDVFLEVVEA